MSDVERALAFSRDRLGLAVAGRLCYSLDAGFFLWRRPYAHAVWHGCVLAGGALHYAAVLRYATPP